MRAFATGGIANALGQGGPQRWGTQFEAFREFIGDVAPNDALNASFRALAGGHR